MMLGSIEVEKAPYAGSPKVARKHLDQVLKLAQAQESTDPEAARLVPAIRQLLTTLDDMTNGSMMGIGSPLGGMPPEFMDLIDQIFGGDDDYDEDEDDEYNDGPFFPFMPSPPPSPRPRKKAGKARKKKRK